MLIIADVKKCLPGKSNNCIYSGTISIDYFPMSKPYFLSHFASYNVVEILLLLLLFSLMSFLGISFGVQSLKMHDKLFLWSASD